MSIVKLAANIIVVNKSDPNSGSSKTFNPRNVAAATAGAIGGFGASEGIEAMKGFNDKLRSHRFGKRMGTAAGAFIGAAGVYSALKKHQKDKNPDIMFY